MWYLGGVDPATTIAFFFEVTNTNATPLPPHKRRYIQFLTSYQASNGRFRLRVTTTCGLWHSDAADHSPIAQSFDQVRRLIRPFTFHIVNFLQEPLVRKFACITAFIHSSAHRRHPRC